MSFNDFVLPFLLCATAGLLLSMFELFKTFGRWLGSYWLNRYVIFIIALNIVVAVFVYAFLHFALGIENTLWLALITGVTFPTILRSRFIFYRPVAKEGIDINGFSLTLDGWYRDLQNICYEVVNNRIAGDRAQTMARLRKCLTPAEMNDHLSDHIESGVMQDKRQEYRQQLRAVMEIEDRKTRERRLAAMMMQLMSDKQIKNLLKGCDK